ncbi:MAG TPA: diacylglycerol kinase family protein [Pyrinomonadaceae bacterium]|jgi:YegS/Rv2252/BmrU family lipid kinase
MPLPLVIVNPTSAAGATGAAWPRLASELRAHFGAFEPAFTAARGDGRRIAARAAAAGRAFIVACGGDGTISEVANGILEAGAPAELGVLPSGTGGDFRRTLALPGGAAAAARALRDGRTELIDVGRVEFVNHEGADEARYFLNVASCGMGGEVVRRVKAEGGGRLARGSARLLGGRGAFALAALQTTLSFTKPIIRVQLDGRPKRRLTVANLCVANARYFGGGMKIAPEAKLNDGLLDVVALGDLDTLTILTNVHRLYLGTHLGMQQVHHAHAQRVIARAADESQPVLLEVDGELVGTLPASFEIKPSALRVRVPG